MSVSFFMMRLTLYLTIFFVPMNFVYSQTSSLPLDFPVIINGEQLPQVEGKNLHNLRVFSFKNGHTSLIPFQIDQLNSDGDWVWGLSKNKNLTHDNEDPDNSNLFDHNDQLLFMTSDLGEKSPLLPHTLLSSDVVLEVQVNKLDSKQALGWVYIAYYASKPPPLSSKNYMNYQADNLRVKSPIYQMTYSNKFIAVMDQLSINGIELIDRLKIRGDIKIGFLFFSSTVNFNEENVEGYPVGYINGPIRIIKRVVNYVVLSSGMRSPSLNCDHFYYSNHAKIPILLSRSFGVKKMSLRIGLDFHNAAFEHLYADGWNKIQSLQNNSIKNHLIDSQESQWMVLSNSSYSLLTYLEVPETIRQHMLISPYIINNSDAINKPETFPGIEPEAGFILNTKKEFPSGEHLLYMNYVLSTNPYRLGNGEKISQLLSTPFKFITQSLPQ